MDDDAIADVHCVDFAVLQAFDPTVTDPTHELAALVLGNARALRGPGVVANMRVGMSDARFYREHGIPTIVYGPTPNNMGGVDEYVTIEDLVTVFYVHALTAFDYLSRDHTGRA
jgi:succinyl-diaminopimelate desuccinylase